MERKKLKKHSLFGGLVFGLLIFGFVQNVPLASAAQGDIGTIIDNLEFDTSFGDTPDIIQASGWPPLAGCSGIWHNPPCRRPGPGSKAK